MDDNEKQNLEKNIPRQPISTFFNVGSILQSLWIRCCSVFPTITNREFMEGQLRIVLYCGIILWGIFVAWKGIG
jgi:hypothetical protein